VPNAFKLFLVVNQTDHPRVAATDLDLEDKLHKQYTRRVLIMADQADQFKQGMSTHAKTETQFRGC
jgi:fructoselysine-6-P-deglycase FrlB-like protein